MKQINTVFFVLLLLISGVAVGQEPNFSKMYYPQRDAPDFSFGDVVGWNIPLNITDPIFQGLGVTIEFSTEENIWNNSILIIGSPYQQSIDYGIDFKENGNTINVSRHVALGDKIGFYNTGSWHKNILKRNTRYVLTVEIDETRFRYSLYEKGFEKDIKYNYEFYGLSGSYVRSRMKASGIAVAVSKRFYHTQTLRVYDLGFGVGVKPIIPERDIRYAHIKNKHSGLYLRRAGNVEIGDFLEQHILSGSANDMWRIAPSMQSNRTINNYECPHVTNQ